MVGDIEVARYALRTFKVSSLPGDTLRSVAKHGDYWDSGTCVAQCLAGGLHEAPTDGCTCGIYGALSLGALRQQFPYQVTQMVAVIAAEGKTIIGDTGLRTQYARVVAYWSPSRGIRHHCKKQFRGARSFGTLDTMLAAYDLPEWLGPARFWSDTQAGLLTADTWTALAQQYTELVGGQCTYVRLYCHGELVADPCRCRLLSWTAGSHLCWDGATLRIRRAVSGELIMTLSATPDGPAVDQASVGHWTLSEGALLCVTPTYRFQWT